MGHHQARHGSLDCMLDKLVPRERAVVVKNAGCSFAARRAHASAQCRAAIPPLMQLGAARLACWHPLLLQKAAA